MRRAVACVVLLSLILGSGFGGCGVIVHGTTQDIEISTDPPGAEVTVLGKTKTTPATFQLARKRSYVITISKPGYEEATVRIMRDFHWTGIVDYFIVFGLGLAIDAAFGGCWELKPTSVSITLDRLPGHVGRDGPDRVRVRLVQLESGLLMATGDPGVSIELR